MPRLDCEKIIGQWLGRNTLTEGELRELARQARQIARKATAPRNAANQNVDIQQLTEQWAERQAAKAKAAKRASLLNATARVNAINYCLDHFAGREAEGLSALMTSSAKLRHGARLSVDNIGAAFEAEYIQGLANELDRLGPMHAKILQKGAMDEHIANALFGFDDPAAPAYKGPKEAYEIAEAIYAFHEKARKNANTYGAWIQKDPNYIVRQTHDQLRLIKAGRDKWIADIENGLDWEKTADGVYFDVTTPEAKAERRAFLERVYDALASGEHEKIQQPGQPGFADPANRPSVMGSVASRLSQHRVLHFATGSDWYRYNQLYGQKSLGEAVVSGLSKLANDTALMRVLGPSPHNNLELIMTALKISLKHKGDFKGDIKLENAKHALRARMAQLDGTQNMDGNPTLGFIARGIRAMNSVTKLGFAMISGFADAPSGGFEARFQGLPFFKTMKQIMGSALKGRGTPEERAILEANGVFFDSVKSALFTKFRGATAPGKLNAMMYQFFKLNGLSLWTDVWKKGFCLTMSNAMTTMTHLKWDGLKNETRRLFSLYKIDEGKWEMLRKGNMKAADGRMYFTAELASQISDADAAAYMKSKGMLVSPARIEQFRAELAQDIRAMFRDRTRYAMLEPDNETQAIITQGLSSGTVAGEAMRCIMQFKSFPILFLQRTIGREFFGRGADSIGQALRMALPNKNAEMSSLLAIMLTTTAFGYLSMTTKELLAGKNPRNPFQDGEQFRKVMIASALQGGGLGIFGDFLFGASSRVGSSFLGTLAGPTLSNMEALYNLYTRIRDGDDINASAYKFLWSNMPGNNLYWLKGAYEYFVGNHICELLNPGFMKRYRNRIYNENKQTFWMPEPTPYEFIEEWTKPKIAARKKRTAEKRAATRKANKEREQAANQKKG